MGKGSKGYVAHSLLELKVTGELNNNRVVEYKHEIFDKIPPDIDIKKKALILCGDKIDAEKAALLRYELGKRGIIVYYYYAGELDYHKLAEETFKNFSKLNKIYDETYHSRIECVQKLLKK